MNGFQRKKITPPSTILTSLRDANPGTLITWVPGFSRASVPDFGFGGDQGRV